MDYLPSFLTGTAGLLFLLLLFYNLWGNKNGSQKVKLPPQPSGGLPFIGHLFELSGQVPLYRTLSSMADKNGPIFMIRIGMHPILVVNNHKIVKECFTKNDKAFSSRPTSSHGKYLGYNYAGFGFAPYGPFWRDMRKITIREILSSQRQETLNNVFVSEINNLVQHLYLFWKRYSYSSRHDENDDEAERLDKNIIESVDLFGMADISDLFPFMKWFNFETRTIKAMKRNNYNMNSILEGWLDEHKLKRSKNGGKSSSDDQQQDFIDALLSELDDESNFGHKRDSIIKGTLTNLVVAGSDTTSIDLIWMLSLLLNNRQAMKQAQEELDLHVGRDRWVESSDTKNLVYLQAIAKESLRLYPPGPLLLPRELTEDCYVNGYLVQKGTRLFVNAWKFQRDPDVWTEPERFMPERFLTSHADVDASGKHYEFLPFGSGRRVCPGYGFAMRLIHLTFSRLLQGFEFTTVMNKPVDMSEGLGLSLTKATPLELLLTPRLSPEFYCS
ncbi:putative Cytochrome P450 [Quillaja saponaria]|uniref:Cytochrome P450 n=1 Tax=Quillaja saponaria TaxID=32244 RepID=A0AAD7L2Y9_QUISA|nr:putative Cytochrome P450 [Quillaja saponaria]